MIYYYFKGAIPLKEMIDNLEQVDLNFLIIKSIRYPTSSSLLLKFSVEKANTLKYLTPLLKAYIPVSSRVLLPSKCPKLAFFPFFCYNVAADS